MGKTENSRNKDSKNKSRYLTLSIVSFVLSFMFFIPFLPLAGSICGIVSLVMISKRKEVKGKGLAISAIIIGILFTLLQVVFVVAVLVLMNNFLGGMFTGVQTVDPTVAINGCIQNNPVGYPREVCILMAIAAHINNLEGVDQNVCNDNIELTDLQHLCNAMLKRDTAYCEQIIDTQSKADCLDLIEELNSNPVSIFGRALAVGNLK